MKKQILELHRKAEFYKKAAWAHYQLSQKSIDFKEDLLKLAKEHSDSCRFYRQAVRDLIGAGW